MLELLLLETGVGEHPFLAVAQGQIEHSHVEGVEAGQGNKLKFIAHGRQFPLEFVNGGVVQLGLPVEGRRAVIRQKFARMFGMDSLGKSAGLFEVGNRGLTPDHVRVRGISPSARNGGFHAVFDVEKSLGGARLIEDKRPVPLVDITGYQPGGIGIGAGHQHRRHAADIRRQPRGDQFVDEFLARDQNLAAEVAAFFGRSQLIFEMDPGRSGRDHHLHQFEGI